MTIIDVATTRELQQFGARAIERARAGGDSVELQLAPGCFEGAAIALGTEGDLVPRLVVRAADPHDPPRLEDVTLHLRARHVIVEGLAIGPQRAAVPILVLEGADVQMRRCALTGCYLDAPPGGSLVDLVAVGDGDAVASLEDCWLVDNDAPERGLAILSADGRPAGFAHLELTRVAFIANRAPVTVLPRATDVRIAGCVVVAPADTPFDGILLAVTTPDIRVAFDGCILAWPDIAALVSPSCEHTGPAARITRSVLACPPGVSEALDLEGVTHATHRIDVAAIRRYAIEQLARADAPELGLLAAAIGIDSG